MNNDYGFGGTAWVTSVEKIEGAGFGEKRVTLWNPITGLKIAVTCSDKTALQKFEECVGDRDRMVSVDLGFMFV